MRHSKGEPTGTDTMDEVGASSMRHLDGAEHTAQEKVVSLQSLVMQPVGQQQVPQQQQQQQQQRQQHKEHGEVIATLEDDKL